MFNQEPLFELIKSLSKSEKRYFKLQAQNNTIGNNNNYITLFDAIDKLNSYDEKKLLKSITKKSIHENISVLKHFLYKQILKSLHHFHSESSADSELKEALHTIEILYEKGLFQQCDKLIQKAKEKAIKYEKYILLIDAIRWEISLMRAQSFTGKNEEDMNVVFKALFKAIDEYKTITEYSFLSSRLFIRIHKKGLIRDVNDLLLDQSFVDKSALKDANPPSPFMASVYLYATLFAYYFNRSNFVKAYQYSKQSMQLWESKSHLIDENPLSYISASANAMACQLNMKKYTEVLQEVEKLKSIKTNSQRIKNLIFYNSNVMKLATYIKTAEFEKGADLAKTLEEQLSILPNKQVLVLNYAMAAVSVGAERYSQALFYLNKILNDKFLDYRSDLQCYAKTLSLVVHFEMENFDFLEYVAKSTYRLLRKREGLYKFEIVLLNYIRRVLLKAGSRGELIKTFKDLKSEIEKLAQDPLEAKFLEYFDFISWLQSKIELKSFSEIVRLKANNQ